MCSDNDKKDISLYYDEFKQVWIIKEGDEVMAKGSTAMECMENYKRINKECLNIFSL